MAQMPRYRGSHEDFDGFVVPKVPGLKQQQATHPHTATAPPALHLMRMSGPLLPCTLPEKLAVSGAMSTVMPIG